MLRANGAGQHPPASSAPAEAARSSQTESKAERRRSNVRTPVTLALRRSAFDSPRGGRQPRAGVPAKSASSTGRPSSGAHPGPGRPGRAAVTGPRSGSRRTPPPRRRSRTTIAAAQAASAARSPTTAIRGRSLARPIETPPTIRPFGSASTKALLKMSSQRLASSDRGSSAAVQAVVDENAPRFVQSTHSHGAKNASVPAAALRYPFETGARARRVDSPT